MSERPGARLVSLEENRIRLHHFGASYLRSDWAELSKYVKIKGVRTVRLFGNIFLRGKSGSC